MNGGDWKTSSFPGKNCLSLEVVWTWFSKKSARQKHLFYRIFSSSHYKCIHPSTLEETFLCLWSAKMGFPDGTGVGKLSCWNGILKLEPKNGAWKAIDIRQIHFNWRLLLQRKSTYCRQFYTIVQWYHQNTAHSLVASFQQQCAFAEKFWDT